MKMQEAKQVNSSKDNTLNRSSQINKTAYEKVVEEKPEDVINQINDEFNVGEKALFTHPDQEAEKEPNESNKDSTLKVEPSNKEATQIENSHQFSRKRRNLYIALFLLFLVGVGAGLGIFLGLNQTKKENIILTARPLDTNSHFHETIKKKAPEEPVIARKFQVGEGYLYQKSSTSQVYKSTNSSERNITLTDSYVSFYVSQKTENNDSKIFFHLKNVSQFDEKKENKTMLVHDPVDILSQISKNASLLNDIYKVPNMTFNMGFFTLSANGTYYDLYINEKFQDNFIFFAKSLIEEFSPILSAKIYQNKGKRMLVEHLQDSTVSGHFDGNLTENGTSLIKTTDSLDYQKDGLGQSADIKTQQISNFDANGTLINSTQQSKVEFNLDKPKNEAEKEYKENSTNSNSILEKEKIYNETVRKNDPEQKYVSNSTDTLSEINQTQSALPANGTLENSNSTNENKAANSTNTNETIENPQPATNDTLSDQSKDTNNTESATTNTTLETTEAQNTTSTDELNVTTNNENSTRLLQEKENESQKNETKGKIIHETSDVFKLISWSFNDEFYNNISSTFLNFEYDENEKPDLEEIEASNVNSTDFSTSDIDDSDLELENENTTKTQNDTNKKGSLNNYNSTENKSLDNSNNTLSKNSTKKKAFILFTEYEKQFKTNSTNEDPSKFPDSKNFRLLLSSSFLEDKVFRMNILSTNILGISVSFHAEGAIRVLNNKLEFGVYLTLLGWRFPLFQGSLEIKISEALKNLLMYNQNLLNQILSLTIFPFADLVKEVSSLREQILKNMDLDAIKAKLLSGLKEITPDLATKLQAFSSELLAHVQNELVNLKVEFSKIFSENIVEKYRNFRNALQAEILSLTKAKWAELKNFLKEAELLNSDITALPQELVDQFIKFKTELKGNLNNKIKEIMVSNVESVTKPAYELIKNKFTPAEGVNLFDLKIREKMQDFAFLDFLNAFSECEAIVKKAIESGYSAEKEKLLVHIDSEFSYLSKTIFETGDIIEVFKKIDTELDLFIIKLRTKVQARVTISSASQEIKRMQSLMDQQFAAIGSYVYKIDLKSYVTINADTVISSINSKVSSTVTTFKAKSNTLIDSLTAKANDCFQKQMSQLEKLETDITQFYSSSKEKILSINKQIEEFVSSNTDKLLNRIFTSSIKKRYLSEKSDLFTEIINAVKNFETFVDDFLPRLTALDIAVDVHEKITIFRNALSKGLTFVETEIDKVLIDITTLFKTEGRTLFKSFITNKLLSGVKLVFKTSNLSAISSNLNTFKDTFKSAVDKFLGFKNTFRGVVDKTKEKISSMISLDGMNFSRDILSRNIKSFKVRQPIQVLCFIIWLETNFTTDLSLSLFSKANLFGIEVGFNFGLGSSMSGSAYLDLYTFYMGVSSNVNLLELSNTTGAEYKLLQLADNFKSCGSIRFLNVNVGIFKRYLIVKISWQCWRVRLWFMNITICVVNYKIYMSDPEYLVSHIAPYTVNSNFCFKNLDNKS